MPFLSPLRHLAADPRPVERRRDLLPLYVKAFTYLFLGTGLLAPPLFILHAYGLPIPMTLYGIEIQELLFHPGGLLVLALYFIKGVAAFGLYNEESWGVDLALFDGVAGIMVCLLALAGVGVIPTADQFWFRPELVLLAPYVFHLSRARRAWAQAEGVRHHFLSW